MRLLLLKSLTYSYSFSKLFQNQISAPSLTIWFTRKKSESSSNRITLITLEEQLQPTGSVHLHLPFNVQVQPLDFEDHPRMDKTLLEVIADCNEPVDKEKLRKLFSWDIEKHSSATSLGIKSHLTDEGLQFCQQSNPFTLKIVLPLHSNIRVNTTGLGNVSVSGMESKNIAVITDRGGIHCKRLKFSEMNLESSGGDILCSGVLQGNLNIRTKAKGSVTGMRFQGNTIDVTTEEGSIDISAIYAEQSNFRSNTGNMNLENYHGNGTVFNIEGNLFVSGLDGSLKVEMEKGNADIQVSRFHSLHILNKKGNIKVNVPETLKASLEIEGKELQIENRLRTQGSIKRNKDQKYLSGFLGSGKGPLMMLFAPSGTISLNIQDWLSSLQLGGVIPEFSHKRESHEPQPLRK